MENKCDLCGNKYETYVIILDSNPLSIASFFEYEMKENENMRNICETCRKSEEHGDRSD